MEEKNENNIEENNTTIENDNNISDIQEIKNDVTINDKVVSEINEEQPPVINKNMDTNNNEEIKEEKPKKKVSVLLVVLLFILALLGALYFFYIKPNRDNKVDIINNNTEKINNTNNNNEEVNNTNDNNEEVNNNENNTEEGNTINVEESKETAKNEINLSELSGLTKEDTSSYKNEYVVNYSDEDNEIYYNCDKKKKNCKKKVTIKTKTKNIVDDGNYKELYYYFIEDGKYKIYSIKTKETYIVNLELNFNDIKTGWVSVIEDEMTDELVGLVYRKEKKGKDSFYSFSLNKILYDNKYSSIYGISNKYLKAYEEKCDEYCEETAAVLLSTNSEVELKRIDYDEEIIESQNFGSYSILNNQNSNNYYVTESVCCYTKEVDEYYDEMYEKGNIYDENLNLIAKDYNFNYVSVDDKGYLNLADDTSVKVYDNKGNIIKTNTDYNVIMLLGNYIVTVKNKRLILATTDGEEIDLGKYTADVREINKFGSLLATDNGFSGVVPVAEDKYVIYILDEDKYIAYYYIPETGKKGTTGRTNIK